MFEYFPVLTQISWDKPASHWIKVRRRWILDWLGVGTMTVWMVPGVASAHAKVLRSAGIRDLGDSMGQTAIPVAAGTWLEVI